MTDEQGEADEGKEHPQFSTDRRTLLKAGVAAAGWGALSRLVRGEDGIPTVRVQLRKDDGSVAFEKTFTG